MAYSPILTSAYIAFDGLLNNFRWQSSASLEPVVEYECTLNHVDRHLYGIILHTAQGIQDLVLNKNIWAHDMTNDILDRRTKSKNFKLLEKCQTNFIRNYMLGSEYCITHDDNGNDAISINRYQYFEKRMKQFSEFLLPADNPTDQEASHLSMLSISVDHTLRSGTHVIRARPKPFIFHPGQ
jgi:hypothetical protein